MSDKRHETAETKDVQIPGSASKVRQRLRPRAPVVDPQTALVLPRARMAFVYQRLSSTEQIKNSLYSLQMQDELEDLAISDGYACELTHDERLSLRQDARYPGWYRNGQIIVEQRDLGISGAKGREERPGLQNLISQIEANRIESVYVVHISRLYRDQTLINAFSFGEMCKQHDVKLITPYMRLNLRLPMHMEWYRREADWAAKELETLTTRLHGARDIKARQGRYAGGNIPRGYVLDTRRKIVVDGREIDNPNFERFRIYEPHARVVRLIMERLRLPGATPLQVVRYCRANHLRFEAFPTELAQVKSNLSVFACARRDADGAWPVSVNTVVSVATNPVYIGWWVWKGEIIRTDNHPPIVDEETFWAVQENMGSAVRRPKGERPPLPLSSLLHCGQHDPPRRMIYGVREDSRLSGYRCQDYVDVTLCWSIMAHVVDDAICDFVLSQFSRPELADAVLKRLTDDYAEAREQAEASRREVERLDQEIENLEHNYRVLKLTPERAARLEADIHALMAEKRRLTEIEAYPAGRVVRALTREDIGLVRSMLTDLRTIWSKQPVEMHGAFLRLVLQQVTLVPERLTIRAVVRWKTGLEHVIDIRRPYVHHYDEWTEEEDVILRKYFPQGRAAVEAMLPHRRYSGIRQRAYAMGIPNEPNAISKAMKGKKLRRWTPEEDEIVRRMARNEIHFLDAMEILGRTEEALRGRIRKLKLHMEKPIIWTLVETRIISADDDCSTCPRWSG